MKITSKKLIIAALAGALLISGMTACGSKDNTPDYDTTSRVLYSDSDTETETDEAAEDTEDTEDTESEETSSKEEKKVKTTDSDKKSSSSKASSSKKTTSSKAASSKAASSKASSKASSTAASSKTASSSAASSKPAETSSKESSSKEESKPGTDTETATDTTVDTDTSDVQFDTETDTSTPSGGFDEKTDLSFVYGSYQIRLEADIDDVIANLGDDYTKTSAPSCLIPGMEDSSYDYGDIVINTFPTADGEGEIVSGIELKSTNVATDGKDISIGDSLRDVLDSYGDNYQLIGTSSYRYVSEDGRFYLSFFIADDTVESITIAIDNKNY